MFKIPVLIWITNAAARLAGTHGDVAQQATTADCSRQTVYDHAQKVRAAVEAEHSGGPTRAELFRGNQHLRREDAQLWDWLADTIEFPPAKQQEFTATAVAMGLSLNQTLVLLAVIMGARARPGRPTIQRWIKAAGRTAGEVLKRLDLACHALVLVGGLDEISFHRRPVLVGVEPASMARSLGRKANDRQGTTWCNALQGRTAPHDVVADAGTGLQAGIALLPRQRCDREQAPLENGWDVSHTAPGARRVLRSARDHAERLWERAEAATRRVEQAQRQGRDARGLAAVAYRAWKKATDAFQQFEDSEAGWRRAHAALQVFRPDGRLNDRPWAAQQIALALPELSGREWSKVRGSLQAEEALTFLDRLHRQLRDVEPDEDALGELVRLWWLRRRRPRGTSSGVVAGSGHVAHLVQMVVCQKRDAAWRGSYRRDGGRACSGRRCVPAVPSSV